MTGHGKRRAYRDGAECWFIDDRGLWYRCKMTRRSTLNIKTTITLVSVTGRDHTDTMDWPYPDGLSFSAGSRNMRRLRPWDALPPVHLI